MWWHGIAGVSITGPASRSSTVAHVVIDTLHNNGQQSIGMVRVYQAGANLSSVSAKSPGCFFLLSSFDISPGEVNYQLSEPQSVDSVDSVDGIAGSASVPTALRWPRTWPGPILGGNLGHACPLPGAFSRSA